MSFIDNPNERSDFELFLKGQMARIHQNLSQEAEEDYFQNIQKIEKQAGEFISNFRKIPFGSESFLFVLRKWNSYTPSLPMPVSTEIKSINQHSVGGGYFLHLQSAQEDVNSGYGLVIDPGYNFIHNFGLSGFCLDDIDGIFITHAHNDHTNDLESLLSILFQRNNRHKHRKRAKKVDLFFNVGSFKKYSNYFDLSSCNENNYLGEIKILSPGQYVKIPNRDDIDCEIVTLYSKHHEIVTANYSLGACFRTGGRLFVLSGDTGWDFDLAKKNEELLRKYNFIDGTSSQVNLLVCHIGTISKMEFQIQESPAIQDCFYPKHLGLLGTLCMIAQYKPEICIISEFGEELSSLRYALAREINISSNIINKESICLPGDIGLAIFLDSKTTIDYLNNKIVDIYSIKYRDVKDSFNQKNIKYFCSDAELNDDEISNIDLTNGLSIFKKHYTEKLFEKDGLNGKDKHHLLRELSSLRTSYDQWTAEEVSRTITNILIALSCLLKNPFEIIPILKEECDVWSIIVFLDAYNIETSCLKDFALIAHKKAGYGLIDHEKSIFQKIFIKESSGIFLKIIENFLNENIQDAKKDINNLKEVTLESLFFRISITDKFSFIVENGEEITSTFNSNPYTKTCLIINKYRELLSRQNSLLREFNDKYILPNIGCFQGAYLRDLDEIKQFEPLSDPEAQSDLEILKKNQTLIQNLDHSLQEIMENISTYFKKISHNIPERPQDIFSAFYLLMNLFILEDENKIDKIVVDAFVKDIADKIGPIQLNTLNHNPIMT